MVTKVNDALTESLVHHGGNEATIHAPLKETFAVCRLPLCRLTFDI
jgi:hypothetical protein